MTSWWRRWFGAPASETAAVAATPPPEPVVTASPWSTYAAMAKACGVDRVYLLLTFDCDTDLDINIVGELDRQLRSKGIKAGYAVPGAQLRKSPETWRAVAERGSEFLNHGDRAHAEFRDGRYWPATFYEKLSPSDVVSDIEAADRTIRELTGADPVGFRAPHFGSFQSPEQLELIYRTVRPLGYRYCSTTTPALALARGPVVDMGGGMIELPTLGSHRNPTTLLDSWTYLTDRVNYALGDEYADLFIETIDRMTADRIPAILTYYGDPSHVFGQRPFERVLDALLRAGIPSLHGRDAVQMFKPI